MIHFRPFPAESLTEDDARLLVKAARFGYCGESAVTLVADGLKGTTQFWRIEGEVEGLLLTKKKKNTDGPTLWIECLVGKGLTENIPQMKKALKDLAWMNDCFTFSGLVFRQGMKWVVEEAKLRTVGVLFSEKVDA